MLIDNFRIGTLEKWGFTDAWFEQHAPRLVRCSITGYGSSGPKAALPGYDFILQAESGLMSICGEPDGGPTKYGVAIVDVCTGMLACNAILAALNARHRTGKGQKVELSLYETSLAMLVNVAQNYLVGRQGRRPFRQRPSEHRAVHDLSGRRRDDRGRRSATSASSRAAAEVLGHPEWAQDARFNSNRDAGREPRCDRRPDQRGAGVATSADAWLAKLKAVGRAVRQDQLGGAGARRSAHAQRAAWSRRSSTRCIGALKMLGIPFKFSDTACSVRRAPPTLGQHTDEILTQELGLDEKSIAQLRQAKVI